MSSTLTLSQHFSELCRRHGVSPSEACSLWSELESKYSQAHRHYHTLRHIADLHEKSLEYRSTCEFAEDFDAIQWAIIYHDVVYDPTSSRNEEDSAALFETHLREQLPSSLVSQVIRYILATKSHAVGDDADSALELFMDLDLSILAAAADDYAAYARAIRLEYIHFSDEDYRKGRIRVLQHFLGHDTCNTTSRCLFRSAVFRSNGAEDNARRNIEWELYELSKQPLSKVIFSREE